MAPICCRWARLGSCELQYERPLTPRLTRLPNVELALWNGVVCARLNFMLGLIAPVRYFEAHEFESRGALDIGFE